MFDANFSQEVTYRNYSCEAYFISKQIRNGNGRVCGKLKYKVLKYSYIDSRDEKWNYLVVMYITN